MVVVRSLQPRVGRRRTISLFLLLLFAQVISLLFLGGGQSYGGDFLRSGASNSTTAITARTIIDAVTSVLLTSTATIQLLTNNATMMMDLPTVLTTGGANNSNASSQQRQQQQHASAAAESSNSSNSSVVAVENSSSSLSSPESVVVSPRHQRDDSATGSSGGGDGGSCAINFYGLPRAFKSLVLPSIVENIIKPNAQYRCDYFVHYHNLSYESAGRSGKGGPIHPRDVFLLQSAVVEQHQQHAAATATAAARGASANNHTTRSHISPPPPPQPIVRFCQDTESQFWSEHERLLDRILVTNHSLYFPRKDGTYTNQSMINIVKMWHGQKMAWDLMRQQEARSGRNYSRVAMLRSDVVYLTPIDIYQRGRVKRIRQSPEDLTADVNNEIVVVPSFSKWPVNDRSIYGPRDAVLLWAGGERLRRLESHVAYVDRHHPGYGMHSEKYLAWTIFPAMKREVGVKIEEHPTQCFVRARADDSVWIQDCEGIRMEPDQLQQQLQKRQTAVEALVGRPCKRGTLTMARRDLAILHCGISGGDHNNQTSSSSS